MNGQHLYLSHYSSSSDSIKIAHERSIIDSSCTACMTFGLIAEKFNQP